VEVCAPFLQTQKFGNMGDERLKAGGLVPLGERESLVCGGANLGRIFRLLKSVVRFVLSYGGDFFMGYENGSNSVMESREQCR